MVRRTLKILQERPQGFESVSDHFGSLRIKGLKFQKVFNTSLIIRGQYSLFFRLLQEKLDQPVSEPASPRKENNDVNVDDLSSNVSALRNEVKNLRNQLAQAQAERKFRSVIAFLKSFDLVKRNTNNGLFRLIIL